VLRRAIRNGSGKGERVSIPSLVVRSTLPTRVARQSLDTAEHRWLAAAIRRIVQLLAALRLTLATDDGERLAQISKEIGTLESKFTRILRIEPFASASEQPPSNFGSLQLMRLPGYRDAYRD